MSPSTNQPNADVNPVVYINKTDEIALHLGSHHLLDGVSKGIMIEEGSSRVYIVPFLPYSQNGRRRVTLVGCYFPGIADWLALKNNDSGNDPYFTLFEHAIKDRLSPLMAERGYSVACPRDVKFTGDLTQIEMTFELDKAELR